MSTTKPVQMRLHAKTIEKIAKLKDLAHLQNNADAVRLSVEIAVMVTEAIRGGDKVLIETKSGSLERVVVPQLM